MLVYIYYKKKQILNNMKINKIEKIREKISGFVINFTILKHSYFDFSGLRKND